MLVSLKAHVPDALIDLRYAGSNNVMRRTLYDVQFEAQLDSTAAEALHTAAKFFAAHNYKLIVWDAFRPVEVQQKLLEAAPTSTTQYVLEDSNHAKGLAVDVTLADAAGVAVDMGTDHDEFSERAHIDAQDLTPDQEQNRAMLAAGMKQAGFTQWPYEWWHFDYLT